MHQFRVDTRQDEVAITLESADMIVIRRTCCLQYIPTLIPEAAEFAEDQVEIGSAFAKGNRRPVVQPIFDVEVSNRRTVGGELICRNVATRGRVACVIVDPNSSRWQESEKS